MYKMSWPDLACASAARVISALLPVKRSIVTSTFSFAAHSCTSASDVLLAPGTQWSHRPTDSFPAARALLTNGAASIVADAAAEVVTNRRRVKAFLFICVPPIICQHGSQSGSETQANNNASHSCQAAALRLSACTRTCGVSKSIHKKAPLHIFAAHHIHRALLAALVSFCRAAQCSNRSTFCAARSSAPMPAEVASTGYSQ